MNIRPTRDWNKMRGILIHPELYGQDTEALQSGTQNPAVTPLMVSDDGDCVAVYMLINTSPNVYEIHCHILPEHMGKYSERATRMAVNWAWNHLNMRRLEAVIPTKFPEMFKHAMTMVFALREVLHNGFRLGGRTYASYRMVKYNGK